MQFLNLSVNGYSIDQEYLYLRRVVDELHPAVVILGVYTGNDYQITAREYGWGHTKPLFEMRGDELVRTNPDLLRDNCIDHLAQSLLFRFLWSDHDRAQDFIDVFCRARILPPWQAEPMMGRLFAETKRVAEAHGARMVFLMLPDTNDFPGVGDQHYALYMSRYAALRDLAAAQHADLWEFYPAVAASGRRLDELYLDGGHYTPVGQQLLAEFILGKLRESRIVP